MTLECFKAIADECRKRGHIDLQLGIDLLAGDFQRLQERIGKLSEEMKELRKKALTLDEIVADSAEQENITYIQRVPQRQRWVPSVIQGGAA